MAVAVGYVGVYHLDPTTPNFDRACIVLAPNGSNWDIHVMYDPATDYVDLGFNAGDPAIPLIRIERNVSQGSGQGQFT